MGTQAKPSGPRERSLLRALGGVVLLVAIPLVAAEGLLRLLPLERLEPEFAAARDLPIFVPGSGPEAGRLVTSERFRGYLNRQSFARAKPPGVFRVFVLGESASFGWPYGARCGFTGLLERALGEHLPGRYEIVNAAGMSFGSLRILDFLREILARYEPDLVIVSCGNNEYSERNFLPRTAQGPAEAVARRLRRSAVYRGLRLLLVRALPGRFAPAPAADPTDVRADPIQQWQLVPTPDVDREVLAGYRRNLSEMADLIEKSGVRGVFCTVPVNLADWAPSQTLPPLSDPGALRRWRESLDAGRAALEGGDLPAALRLLGDARALAPADPLAIFWHGRALLAARAPGAREALELAAARDPRALRARPAFNEHLRTLAQGRDRVSVLDLEAVFAAASPGGVPGDGLFLDHVHFSQDGHRLVAAALPATLGALSGDSLPAGVMDWLVASDRACEGSPAVRFDEAFARGLGHLHMGRPAEARAAFETVLEGDTPARPSALICLADVLAAQGDAARAAQLYEEAEAGGGDNPWLLTRVAAFHLAQGRLDEAGRLFARAVEFGRLNAEAHAGLGSVAAARGDHRAAIAGFAEAAALGHETAAMHRSWGDALSASGEPAAALAHWERALALDPLDDESRRRIAARQGAVR